MKTLKISMPVSRKAYAEFCNRICQVFASDPIGKDAMLNALNRYINGEKDIAEMLEPMMRMAFEFLRHDVDKAMERSRSARERARNRHKDSERMNKAMLESLVDEHLSRIFTIVDDADETESVDHTLRRPLTRRERRARERRERGKSRIKPLSPRLG